MFQVKNSQINSILRRQKFETKKKYTANLKELLQYKQITKPRQLRPEQDLLDFNLFTCETIAYVARLIVKNKIRRGQF